MNETITTIVNLLFEDVAETEETLAMREEILNNCQERFSDLVMDGMDADTATAAIVESLKGMEEVLQHYPRKTDVNAPADEQAFRAAGFEETPVFAEEQPEAPFRSAYTFAPVNIQTVSAQLTGEDVDIGPSPDGLVHVSCDNDSLCLKAEVTGGTLHIRVEDQEEADSAEESIEFPREFDLASLGDTIQKIFSASWKKIVRHVTAHENDATITILLPKSSGIAVEISTISGDFQVDDLELGGLRLSSTSGDVNLSRLAMNSCKVTTTSGDIDAEQVTVRESVQLNTIDGDVEWNGSCTGFKATTVDGDVELVGSFLAAEIKTVSGDVEARANEGCTVGRVGVQSISGDLSVSLPSAVQAAIQCKSMSGSIHQHRGSVNGMGSASVQLQTVSGDISVY